MQLLPNTPMALHGITQINNMRIRRWSYLHAAACKREPEPHIRTPDVAAIPKPQLKTAIMWHPSPYLHAAACKREPEAHIHTLFLQVLLPKQLREPHIRQLCNRKRRYSQHQRLLVCGCKQRQRLRARVLRAA
jgi:hypothetical protein